MQVYSVNSKPVWFSEFQASKSHMVRLCLKQTKSHFKNGRAKHSHCTGEQNEGLNGKEPFLQLAIKIQVGMI